MATENQILYLPGRKMDDILLPKTENPIWWRSIAKADACFKCRCLHNQIVKMENPKVLQHHVNCRCFISPIGIEDMTKREQMDLGIQSSEQQDGEILSASDMAAMLALQLTLIKLIIKEDEYGMVAVLHAMDAIRLKPVYNGKYDRQGKDGNCTPSRSYTKADGHVTITINVLLGITLNYGEKIAMYVADILGAIPFGPLWGPTWGLYKAGIQNGHQDVNLPDILEIIASALLDVCTPDVVGVVISLLGIVETTRFKGTHPDDSLYVEVTVNYLSQVDQYTYEFSNDLSRILNASDTSQDVYAGYSFGSGELEKKIPILKMDGLDDYYVYRRPV